MRKQLIGISCAVAAFYGAIGITAHADSFGVSLPQIVGLLGTGSTAASNLGLGTAATANTGTSGAALCLASGGCAFSGNISIGTSTLAGFLINGVFPVTTSTPAREMQFSDNTNTTLAMFASTTMAMWTSNNTMCLSSNNSTTGQFCVLSGGDVSTIAAEDHAVSSVTASFTFDATMQMRVADATSGNIVGTLPSCVAAIAGREYTLVKGDTSTNTVSFAPNGTDKISGSNASLSVGTTQGSAINLRCNGNATGVTAGWWRH